MSTNFSFEHGQMLIRVARAEDGIDVTTMMQAFRQTPAVIAHFSRRMKDAGLLTIDKSRLQATREGREAAARIAAAKSQKQPGQPPVLPEAFRKQELPAFTPYLPKRSEVDPEILKLTGQEANNHDT